MNKAIFLLSILFCCVCNVASQEQIEEEEYRIYKFFLEEWFITPRTTHIVIDKFTVSNDSENSSKYIKRKLSGIKSETLADYTFRNNRSFEIKNNFGISQVVWLITEEDVTSVYRQEVYQQERVDLSEAFKKAFKEKFFTEHQISFSRVGFNKSKNQALVQVGYSCGMTCGEGNYVLLIKKNHQWIIQKKMMSWIS